jgi:malic enzyme
VPSVFDKRVTEAVARSVNEAAHLTGVARRALSRWGEDLAHARHVSAKS